MYGTYCRTFQGVMRIATKFLPWREPELITGENSLRRLASIIQQQNVTSVLIVTDQGIVATGLMNELLDDLKNKSIDFVIYDETVPNPTIDNIEDALKLYRANFCQGIVAFGGGSPMDCAKGVGARVARPNRSIPDMKGLLKIRKKMPPFFAIPTTAGTGSEATLAAVVSNPKTHEKYALMDTSLIPRYAVLDPMLTVKLPKHITSTTGMDALTHAIEAYIGKSNTELTEKCSREAVKIIFQDLRKAYNNGEDLEVRTNMQKAAYLAGVAFTRAYVGYVHCIAHTLGGFYSVPHGLANAVILPYVLEYYGESVHERLAELADLVGITKECDTAQQKADTFIQAIRQMNKDMNIPEKIEGIQDVDIPLMIERALKEGNPIYPVPKIFNRSDMLALYGIIQA